MQLAAFLCVICVICGRIFTQEYSIYIAQMKPQKSPADLADLRRQNTNSKTTITAIISQPSPTCLSLRNNAACCIRLRNLRYLRENKHARVLNLCTKKPQCLPQISLIYADKPQTTDPNYPQNTLTTPTCLSLRNNAALLHSSA